MLIFSLPFSVFSFCFSKLKRWVYNYLTKEWRSLINLFLIDMKTYVPNWSLVLKSGMIFFGRTKSFPNNLVTMTRVTDFCGVEWKFFLKSTVSFWFSRKIRFSCKTRINDLKVIWPITQFISCRYTFSKSNLLAKRKFSFTIWILH